MTASERFSLTLSLIALAPLVLGLLLIAVFTAAPAEMPMVAGADQSQQHSTPAPLDKAPA